MDFISLFPILFSVLLSTVSGEDTQDRTDRIMLMPWVKFLWESFRNVLELLKNNRQLEAIYVHVAKRGSNYKFTFNSQIISYSLSSSICFLS